VIAAPVSFASTDPSVFTVSAEGLVSAVSPGAAFLVATVSSAPTVRDTARVRVVAVTSVEFGVDSLSVLIGQAAQAVAAARAGADVVTAPVRYGSTDTLVITVDSSGSVTGLNPGSAFVVASLGDLRDSLVVVVPRYQSLVTGLPANGTPYGVAVSSQHVLAVTQFATDRVAFYRLPSLQGIGSVAVGDGPIDVAFSSGGQVAYVAGLTDTITVVDVPSLTVTARWPTGGVYPGKLLLSSDHATLFVGGYEDNGYATGHVIIMDAATGATRTDVTVNVAGPVNGLALSPDGSLLYAPTWEGTVAVINTAAGIVVRTDTLDENGSETLQGVALSPSGDEVYVASESMGLYVMSAGGALLATISALQAAPFDVVTTPDGAFLLVSGYCGSCAQRGRVVLIERQTRRVVRVMLLPQQPRRIAFDASRTAYVAAENGVVHVIR
jgi:DNA-binding beta-propeller fold protein YncE